MRTVRLISLVLFPLLFCFCKTEVKEETHIQYVIAHEQPEIQDKGWKNITFQNGEVVLENPDKDSRLWIRVSRNTALSGWFVYGPLKGENQQVEIIPIEEEEEGETVQFATTRSMEEGLGCCKVKVRIKVKVKTPKVVVRNPVPDVTVRWKGPVPGITVQGPDITISDLPRLPSAQIHVQETGSVPNAGMKCEMNNGKAVLYIQNGEAHPVDIWISWLGVPLGPIAVESRSMRKLPETDFKDCKTALENIYIIKSK